MNREELIAYDRWLTENKWGSSEIITPEQAADLYLAKHPLPPAEGAKTCWNCGIDLRHAPDGVTAHHCSCGATNPGERQPQPTAEGAEEKSLIGKPSIPFGFRQRIYTEETVKVMIQEHTTLHAQRIADKMVSERLMEELIKYDTWVGKYKWVFDMRTAKEAVDEYLKSRER